MSFVDFFICFWEMAIGKKTSSALAMATTAHSNNEPKQWKRKRVLTESQEAAHLCGVYKPFKGIRALLIYDGKVAHGRYVILK